MENSTNTRPAARPPAAASTALAKVEQAVGSYRGAGQVTEALRRAQEIGHLVSPATACARIADGCEVVISAVLVDPVRETYDVGGGKRGLGKVALDKISAAAALTWDPVLSHRTDDGSDPRYCSYQAVGYGKTFEGSPLTLPVGEKEMDLRENSPQVEAIVERCIRKLGREADGKTPAECKALGRERAENQIREMRLHILGHAATKARLRVVRDLGLRASYEPAELEKPFLVARVAFTGHSDDLELRRAFALRIADQMLGGTRALYGAPAESHRVIDVGGGARYLAPPPPVGTVPFDEDDYQGEPEPQWAPPPPREATPAPISAPTNGRAKPAQAAPADPPTAGAPNTGGIDTTKIRVPMGREKGTTLDRAEIGTLEWLRKVVPEGIADPAKAKYRASNESLLAAVLAEIGYRDAEAAEQERERAQADAALAEDGGH